MSGKTVKQAVHVFNPETGDSEVLSPGMKVPAYATDQVTNPKVFQDTPGADEAVNNDVSVTVQEGTQGVDGTEVTAESSEDDDLGEVNETPNANPSQRPTAGEPGGNQAAKVGEVAVADQPFVTDEAASAPAPAKKTAAKKTAAKKTAAKKTAAKKTAANRRPKDEPTG